MLAYHFCVYVCILSCDASTKGHALSLKWTQFCKTEITCSAVRLKILCNRGLKYMNHLSSVCVCIYISFIVQQKKI